MSALAVQRATDTLFDPDGRVPSTGSQTLVDVSAGYPRSGSHTLFGTTGGGPRLDDLVSGLWEGLAAHRVVECPVCAGDMDPEYGGHARPVAGRCRVCGSTLS